MKNKGEISALKARLLVLASFIDDAAFLALIFLVLRLFHVTITWPVILLTVLAVVAYFVIINKAVVPALRRRNITGSEGMIGQTGRVTRPLAPEGVIKIKDEYWDAKSVDDDIGIDGDVEVVGINGLILTVKRKKP
jgi:membrane-bound serine protease (ClpP class)